MAAPVISAGTDDSRWLARDRTPSGLLAEKALWNWLSRLKNT
jgi:hypothetical protein